MKKKKMDVLNYFHCKKQEQKQRTKKHLYKGNREDQIDKCHTKEKTFFKHE